MDCSITANVYFNYQLKYISCEQITQFTKNNKVIVSVYLITLHCKKPLCTTSKGPIHKKRQNILISVLDLGQ